MHGVGVNYLWDEMAQERRGLPSGDPCVADSESTRAASAEKGAS